MDQATREAIRQDLANSHDELETARILHREGKYRQALSRAYYAVFYAATALLGSKQVKRAKHSGVQSAFGQFFVKNKLTDRKIFARGRRTLILAPTIFHQISAELLCRFFSLDRLHAS